MGTKQFDSATDLITFTRASGGTALRKVSYGNELVTNGNGTTTAGWTTSGIAIFTSDGSEFFVDRNGSGVTNGPRQAGILTTGKVYKVTADIISLTDTFSIYMGAATVEAEAKFTVVGLGQVRYITATGADLFIQATGAGFATATIDNVSVKEVLYDQPDGTLQLFNSPANVPRIEYNADGTVKGLLIEEARTNLTTYSEDFTHSSWSKTGLTAAAASQTGPDGQTSMSTITVSSTNSTHEMLQSAVATSSNAVMTGSVIVRAGTARYVGLRLYGRVDRWSTAVFDLTTASVTQESVGATSGTILSSNIENLGGGLYRLSLTAFNSWTTNVLVVQLHNTGTPSINIYGGASWLGAGETIELGFMQHEQGAFPTSYIPTSGSTATRAMDLTTLPTSAFGYNQKAGTVALEFKSNNPSGQQYGAFNLSDGTANNRVIHYTSSQYHRVFVRNTSGIQVDIAVGNRGATSELVKFALAFAEDDFAASLDGASVVTDTSGTFPSGISVLGIGYFYPYQPSSNLINGHLKSIKYYPRRLTNTQLQELTT